MTLVTTEQAIAHVRADGDENVSLYLEAAEQKAMDFLGRKVYASLGEMEAAVLAGTAGEDPMLVNAAIKAAILLIFGHLYRNREAVITGSSAAAIKVPMSAEEFLWPHRSGLGI